MTGASTVGSGVRGGRNPWVRIGWVMWFSCLEHVLRFLGVRNACFCVFADAIAGWMVLMMMMMMVADTCHCIDNMNSNSSYSSDHVIDDAGMARLSLGSTMHQSATEQMLSLSNVSFSQPSFSVPFSSPGFSFRCLSSKTANWQTKKSHSVCH